MFKTDWKFNKLRIIIVLSAKIFQIDNITVVDLGFVNFIEFGEKARPKSELYRQLTAEGHIYLPLYKICSDILSRIL